jgi:cell division protein FtsL
MTIIQPNKNKNPLRGINAVLIVLLFTSVVTSISLCSKAESLRFEAQKLKKEIDQSQLVNAELEGKIMKAIDTENINLLASEKGLIEDKNPQWVFALQ